MSRGRVVAGIVAALVLAACSSARDDGAASAPSGDAGANVSTNGATAAKNNKAATALAPTTTTIPTAPADTPEGIAAQVVLIERALRDPAITADIAVRLGTLQQLVYRRLGGRAEWDEPVASRLPADVRRIYDNNVAGQRYARQQAAAAAASPTTRRPTPPLDTVPAWRIVEPRPVAELIGYYREAEAATGIGWHWLAAINLVETRVGRIVGISSAGARGPMQFLPTTWAQCCTGNIDDVRDAIIGAATYLKQSGGPANMEKAVLQYNPIQSYLVSVRAYAANIRDNERAFLGYHAWQVFYTTSVGDVRLPVGYSADKPLPAAEYLAAHPEDRG